MQKPKVLILYNRIFHYRIPIWNLLAEKCDLTVVYCEGNVPKELKCTFRIEHIDYSKIGPFVWHKANIQKMAKDYDAVIVYGDVTWIKYMILPWFGYKRVAFWTIGVSTSDGYDSKQRKDIVFRFFYKKAKSIIFYSDDPLNKYVTHGFKRESLFVANNTVEVLDVPIPKDKNYISFIGTLHKRKGIDLLLESYFELSKKCALPKLVIVGNGPEYNAIEQWIAENNMSQFIELKGSIIDPQIKADVLSHSLACISPKQAGLSVLECMGYGVPFVTTRTAITGGERFNIHNQIDGVIMDDESQLQEVIYDISQNPKKYKEMGIRAKEYYKSERTPQQMADGLWEAICYLLDEA